MALEIDRRDLDQADAARTTLAAASLESSATKASRGGQVNPFTGTPACIAVRYRTEPGAHLGECAAHHLKRLASELARAGEDPPELVADPHVIETSGERIVHLQQHFHGLPVFRAQRIARFDRDGTLLDVLGDHVPLRRREIDLTATLDAAGAVLAAARHLAVSGGSADDGGLGLKVTRRRPRVVTAFPLPASPHVLRKPPFPGLIAVHQILFYERPGVRLGWYVPLRLPAALGQYDLIVAANGDGAGEILFCCSAAATGAAEAMATRHNPDEEALRLRPMPSPLPEYPPFRPSGLPTGFPGSWVDRNRTEGNNVRCLRGGRSVQGTQAGATLSFRPTSKSDDELVVNAFFLCNYLHDFFYLLGFDEAAGNFQQRNSLSAGRGGDELEVRIFDLVRGDASMLTEVDGHNAQLNLGAIQPLSGPKRHTALDADVVIHELVHGVTARLVGGRGVWKPMVGGPPQAQALDEGTSDYFALTIQNYFRQREGRPARLVYGAWSSGNPLTGRRRFSYEGFNQPFSRLGQADFNKPHDAGMIWCAALLSMNRLLGAAHGQAQRGHEIGWQLVVNALKQLPSGQDAPSFLDGRNAILRALAALRGAVPVLADGPLFPPDRFGALEAAVRQAFAALGMGRDARSRGGTFSGLQDDFTP